MLSTIKLLAVWITLAIPVAIIGIPVTWFRGNVIFLHHWSMVIVRAGLRAAGIRVTPRYELEFPPGEAFIFMANHVSNLDPPVLASLLPSPTSMLLKSSLMNIPVLGYAMRLARYVPVERDGRLESAKESMRKAEEVLRFGMHLTIFAEGTRSPDGRMLPFKKGPFVIAMHSGARIVPVSIAGTESMLQKGSVRLTPGTARVTFHPALNPKQFPGRDALMAAVRTAIESGLPEWMWSGESGEPRSSEAKA